MGWFGPQSGACGCCCADVGACQCRENGEAPQDFQCYEITINDIDSGTGFCGNQPGTIQWNDCSTLSYLFELGCDESVSDYAENSCDAASISPFLSGATYRLEWGASWVTNTNSIQAYVTSQISANCVSGTPVIYRRTLTLTWTFAVGTGADGCPTRACTPTLSVDVECVVSDTDNPGGLIVDCADTYDCSGVDITQFLCSFDNVTYSLTEVACP